MSNKENEKSTGTETVKPKIFNLLSKTLSRYQTNILLHDLKFTPTPKRNNIELKANQLEFTSNQPQYCLTNIPFSFARRIFTIVENENGKEKRFKELMIIEASIL